MTQLRKKMLEELQRRNYAQSTANQYIRIVREFAETLRQSAGSTRSGPDSGVFSLPIPGAEARPSNRAAACGRSALLLVIAMFP